MQDGISVFGRDCREKPLGTWKTLEQSENDYKEKYDHNGEIRKRKYVKDYKKWPRLPGQRNLLWKDCKTRRPMRMKDISAACGIHPARFSRLVNGKIFPTEKEISSLTQYFNKTEKELFSTITTKV